MLKRLHLASAEHDVVGQTISIITGWSVESPRLMKCEIWQPRSSAFIPIDSAGIPVSLGVRIVFRYCDSGMYLQSLCAEYAIVSSVTLPSSTSSWGTNFANAYSPSVHGGRLASWIRIAAAESRGRRKSGRLGGSPMMFELKDVAKDNGNVVLDAYSAVVKRKDVSGTVRIARTVDMNMHAASRKCLFRSATHQL